MFLPPKTVIFFIFFFFFSGCRTCHNFNFELEREKILAIILNERKGYFFFFFNLNKKCTSQRAFLKKII